jgi:hypothetical protein
MEAGIALLALLISIASLGYTVRQIHLLRCQLQEDVNFRMVGVNRELLAMAFEDAELFKLFEGKPMQNTCKQDHYIQMWINYTQLMWSARGKNLIDDSVWYSIEKEFRDFVSIPAVRKHWETKRKFYPPDFAQFVTRCCQ